MSFKTASAILRGIWLINPEYARSQMPIVVGMLKGDTNAADAGLGLYKERTEKLPQSMWMPKKAQISGTASDVYRVTPFVSTDRLPYNSIAMVDILGPILKYGDYCTYGTVEYNDLMIRLANSPRVTGIILNIDSPGGQAAGTATLAATIREVSKNSKPVLGIVQDGIAASAAMWIGSAVQELYVTQETDQVGSIGAYQLFYDYSGMLEQLGIKQHLIMAPQSDDKIKDYLSALEGDYTLIKEDLKFLVQDFIKAVKLGRGARLNTSVENPFTGKMYNAAAAKKIGLIDGVKSMSGVIARMEQLIKLRA